MQRKASLIEAFLFGFVDACILFVNMRWYERCLGVGSK